MEYINDIKRLSAEVGRLNDSILELRVVYNIDKDNYVLNRIMRLHNSVKRYDFIINKSIHNYAREKYGNGWVNIEF